MVVAGGGGTRLAPLTDATPKPLLPLGNAPFLLGVVERLAATGVRRVFLVVGDDTSPFAVLHAPALARGVEIVLVPEPEPLDTAGGVRTAMDQVDGTVFVLNGDVLTDLDLDAMVTHHRSHDADATISLTLVDDTSSYGVCVREGTRIVDFVEKPEPGTLPGQRGVNAGTYLLEPDVLDTFPHGRLSFERQVFPGLLADGRVVEGFAWTGVWADLGTPARYRRGHRLVLDGSMAWPSVEAVPGDGEGIRVHPDAVVDPAATLVGPCLVGAGAEVSAGAIVGPHTTLGPGTRVGARARLTDTVLLAGAHVGADVTAEGLLAGAGAVVADDVELGDDVVLGDRVVVASRARVADGARLGDAAHHPPHRADGS